MGQPLTVCANPCTTCPYRKDTPPGIWAREEYEKLRAYDQEGALLPLFLCHQSNGQEQRIACKGFLMVHMDSITVRLAQIKGEVDSSAFAPTKAPLYASGNEAADAGERGIRRPAKKAREAIHRLLRKRKGKGGPLRGRPA